MHFFLILVLLAFICIWPFISGFTNLQCNLFTAKATFKTSWETRVTNYCQKIQISIFIILCTKPFCLTHPLFHGTMIRREQWGNMVEIQLGKVAFHVKERLSYVISPPCLVSGSFPRFNCLDYVILFRHVQQQHVENSCGSDLCSLKMKNSTVKMIHNFKLISMYSLVKRSK